MSLPRGEEEIETIGNVSYPEVEPAAGNLIFDASFESGNLGRADKISQSEYDLFIRPDTLGEKYRVWFYFETKNATENQRVIFNIVNFSKQRTLFEMGIAAPVVKSAENNNWTRIPSRHIYYYRSTQHSDRWILSFAFIFESPDPVQFAYCIPYTYGYMQKWLGELEARKYTFFSRDLLAMSVQKRRLDLLTIDGSTDPLTNSGAKKMIFLTARIHPGETPSSHVMHGIIEFLVSKDERAQKLRKVYCFKLIPMLNPDGVYHGNYRCSLVGHDLNRMWRQPSEWAHPTIFAVKNLLQQYDANPMANPVIYIDLHAHSQKPNCFLYGNVSANSGDRQLWLPQLLSEIAEDYSLEFTQFNTDVEKAGTGRRTMGELLGCLCYTMEVSFFSYRHLDSATGVQHCTAYLQYKYESLGESICKALLNFYEADCGIREIRPTRSFRSFLSNRAQKSLKQARQMIKTVKNISIDRS
ncbi:unnamed protein product [Caenorhabditis angaria]|uniref:Peptidase M14 domain-containing protein n=1 Tax=Caenorhabditis angaria TaxID=860376 RepID=A0A9P1MUS1_9PELO|nr:unnamed protein product [Caenorhabditis angaria]